MNSMFNVTIQNPQLSNEQMVIHFSETSYNSGNKFVNLFGNDLVS